MSSSIVIRAICLFTFWMALVAASEVARADGDGSSGGLVKASRDGANASDSGNEVKSKSASAKKSSDDLAEVVVTAQRREERLKDVPISISVLRGEDLDNSTGRSVMEDLKMVPGVVVDNGILEGRIVIRGVAPLAGTSSIAYYLDSAPFGFVGQSVSPDAGTYDLQQVEVLRGPQGTLYGASAQSGVVRVLTHDADLNNFELKARTSGSDTEEGSGDSYSASAAVNVPIVEGKLAARAVVDYQNLGGWIDGPLGNDLNGGQLRNYRLKINAEPTEYLSLGAFAWSSRNHLDSPQGSTPDYRITAVIPEPTSTDYDVYGFKIGYEFPSFSASLVTSYLDYVTAATVDLGIFPGLDVCCRGFSSSSSVGSRIFSEELILNSAPGSAWKWTVGGFYRDGEDRTRVWIPDFYGDEPFVDKFTSRSYAGFGQFGRRFWNDKWEWTLGVRYFHDDVSGVSSGPGLAPPPAPPEASFTSTTPRAVLTWYPTGNLTVYGSYAEGFRSGFPAGVTERLLGFPDVKPDKLHNYEIGAKADVWDRRVTFDGAVYFMKWTDVQQSLNVSIDNGLQAGVLLNGESASGLGLDFATTIRPLEDLQFGVNLSWNDLTMDADVYSGVPPQRLYAKGDRLSGSSEWTVGASVDYSLPIRSSGFKTQFSASANYTSEQITRALRADTVFTGTGDSLLFADAGVSLVAPRHWRATLFVNNATNEHGAFTDAESAAAPELVRYPRPRTVGLQFDYRY